MRHACTQFNALLRIGCADDRADSGIAGLATRFLAPLFDQIRNTFDAAEQTKVLQKVHEKYVDDALFLMVTHDVNPRAMSPRVKGFVQAQNWFQDFSPITMAK